MKLNVEVNSGAAYVISLASVIAFALYIKAPFSEFFFGVGSLYGWHSGRRLWKELKIGASSTTNGETNGEK